MRAMAEAFIALNVAVLTISDTRTLADDRSGALIVERLEQAGHRVVKREVLPDDLEGLVATLRSLTRAGEAATDIDVVITTGGTGLTLRDISPDALAAVADKAIPGFGELFRMLSYRDIGTSTIQSRADAALCGRALVFVLPGSTGACKLAMDEILIPQLDARHRPCNFAELLPRMRGEAPKN